MADNLVKRLRNVQFWQAECDVRMQAAARIEELEAKLANAIDALQLADAAMSGANMNMSVVERKVKAIIARSKDSSHE